MSGPLRIFAALAFLAGLPGLLVAMLALMAKDETKWAAVIPLAWFLAWTFNAVLCAAFAQVLDLLANIAHNTQRSAAKPAAIIQQTAPVMQAHPTPYHAPGGWAPPAQ